MKWSYSKRDSHVLDCKSYSLRRDHYTKRDSHIIGLYSLQRRRLWGDLNETFKIVNGFECIDLKKFFRAKTTQLRGHCGKLFKNRSKLLCRTVASTFLANELLEPACSPSKSLKRSLLTCLKEDWTNIIIYKCGDEQ